MEIRDARTGKPLPRYEVNHLGEIILNKDGSPKLNPVREQVIKELQQPPFNAQHGAHLDWKYDHLSREAPTTSPISAPIRAPCTCAFRRGFPRPR